jgi:diguanylate cyclase
MSIFSKDQDKGSSSEEPEMIEEATRIAAIETFADNAADTIARILREYGRFGFDIEVMAAEDLQRHCDTWARHILTGTPPPSGQRDQEDSSQLQSVALHQRHLPNLLQFFRNHRRDEQAAVLNSAKGMRGLISDMTNGLRISISEDKSSDERVRDEMASMNSMLKSNSLEEIRQKLGRTIELVTQVTQQRQQRYETQLESMVKRVRALREDLIALREKVDLDALTRLYNRGAFDAVLTRQTDYSFLSGQTMSLIMLDLDDFKQINDSYGHPAGDLVLRKVADTLVREFPRRCDFIARYGGEEFVIILVDIVPEEQTSIANRLLETIRSLSIDYEGTDIQVTASIGVSACRPEDNAEMLLKRADHALYQAKQGGRDRVVIAPD